MASYLDTLKAEAPETLQAPTRQQFDTDANYQKAFSQFSTTGNWATPAPGVINASSLNTPQASFKFPSQVDNTGLYTNSLNQLGSMAQSNIEADQAFQESQNKANEIQQDASSINALRNMVSGKEAYSQQQQEAAGVNTARKGLTDINKRILGLNAQVQNIPALGEQAAIGMGGLSYNRGRKDAAALREASIQGNILMAQQAAAQLDLDTAKELATNAVNLKYKDAEDELKARIEAFDLNQKVYTTLSQKQRDAWDRAKYTAEQEQKKLDEKKKNEEAIQNMIVEATPNAPASVIANARKLAESGASRLAVAQSLGVYGGDYLKNELLREQLKTEKAQRAKIYSDMEANAGVGTISPTQVKTATDLQSATANLKLTEGQSKALAFGQRAVNADKALRERLETYDPTTIFSATGRLLKTDNARAFQRDLSDFITAVLRKESGATITEDEFDRFIPLYSPQGIMTNQQDVVQTNLKRDSAIDALISEAGPASAALAAYKNAGKQTEFVSTGNQAADDYFMRSSSALGNVNSSLSTPNAMTAGYVDNQK